MILKRGSRGYEVEVLQAFLHKDGLYDYDDPKLKKFDGKFGKLVEGAVKEWKIWKVWKDTNGTVDTEDFPAFKDDVKPAPGMEQYTTAKVYKMFPNGKRVKGNIDRYLPYVLNSLKKQKLDYKDMVLMALSTIRAESEAFEPISEYKSKWNTSPGGEPYALYDFRTDIGNNAEGDGALYKGRGFIQLTGKYNYKEYGKRIGIDLVNNPELANAPEYAADILAMFLKDKEAKINTVIQNGDMARARKLVNGGSHGLDVFVEAFEMGENLFS
jgi:hypothetical protein